MTKPLVPKTGAPGQALEQEQAEGEPKKEENLLCGVIKLKKLTTRWNVFAIFWSCFVGTLVSGYLNAQSIYLLRDEEYFDVDEDDIGKTSSTVLMTASGISTFWTFAAGPIYDICLRKVPITISVLVAALFLGLCPETAPSLTLFTINRVIIAICQT